MNIIKYNLPIQPNRAHQQFIKRTETKAFDRSRMLIKWACQLIGIDVMKVYVSIVGDTSQGLFKQITKL